MNPKFPACLMIWTTCALKSSNIGQKMAESSFGLPRQITATFWHLNLVLNHDIVSPTFRTIPPEIFNHLHL